MKIINTKIKGLIVVKQNNFKDKRGSLRITHNESILKKKVIKINSILSKLLICSLLFLAKAKTGKCHKYNE